jgi:hypothetical protein
MLFVGVIVAVLEGVGEFVAHALGWLLVYSSPSGRRLVRVAVWVAVNVGVRVGVEVTDVVGVFVLIGVLVGVRVGVCVSVDV